MRSRPWQVSWSERDGFLGRVDLADQIVARLEPRDRLHLVVERLARRRQAHRDLDGVAVVGQSGVVSFPVLPTPEALPPAPMKVGQRRGGAVIPRSFPLPPFPNPTCVFRYASGSPLVLVAKPGVFIQPNWKGCTRRRAM